MRYHIDTELSELQSYTVKSALIPKARQRHPLRPASYPTEVWTNDEFEDVWRLSSTARIYVFTVRDTVQVHRRQALQISVLRNPSPRLSARGRPTMPSESHSGSPDQGEISGSNHDSRRQFVKWSWEAESIADCNQGPGPFWQQYDSPPGTNSHIWSVKGRSLWSCLFAVCYRLMKMTAHVTRE